MPTFQYQAVTAGGRSAAGTIDALDRAEAIRALRQRGETATKLVALDGGGAGAASLANGAIGLPATNGAIAKAGMAGGERIARTSTDRTAPPRRTAKPAAGAVAAPVKARTPAIRGTMSRTELANFIREIATALEAGLPLMNALRATSKQAANPRQLAVLDHLMDRIEAGRSLAQAAQEWGAPFDDMIVGMLRAGEASGRLEVVMMQLADLLDREIEVKRSVATALVYPAILIVILSLGVAIIVTVIIPRVLASLEGQNIVLPLPTRIVKGAADFLGNYWYLLIGGAVVAWMAWKTAMAKPAIRFAKDRAMLRVPVVGAMLRDVAVGRFTRTLGTLMGSGIPIIDAIVITRDTLGNKAMERVIDDVAEKIREGKSIAEPMEKSGYFPPILIQIIDLGERSGRLDSMLVHAADSFDRKTGASIKIFTAALPPVIVVLMAVVIGFVILSVILPLLELQSAIG